MPRPKATFPKNTVITFRVSALMSEQLRAIAADLRKHEARGQMPKPNGGVPAPTGPADDDDSEPVRSL
jgi:hypothetical protein